MWLLLAGMVISAVVASLALTSLIYAVTPQIGTLVIGAGALASLIAWLTIAMFTLEQAYEPDRPTRLPVSTVPVQSER